MIKSVRITIVTAAAALFAAMVLVPVPGLGQDDAKAKAKAAAKAKQNAINFEQNARNLTVFDREGKIVAQLGDRALYTQPVFSPDRTRVAVVKADLMAQTSDLWVVEVATAKATRVT